MVKGQDRVIATAAIPGSFDRRKAPTSLMQAEIAGLQHTQLLTFDRLHSPIIRTAISYWMSKQQDEMPMRRCQFDATEIPHLLPYLLLLEVVPMISCAVRPASFNDQARPCGGDEGGDHALAGSGLNRHDLNGCGQEAGEAEDKPGPKIDFRYRVIGDVVLRYSRGNYTGKCFSEVDGQGPGSEVWRVCTAVAEQRRPRLLCPPYVGPLHHIFYCESVTMPLVDESGRTERLLIACDFLPEPALGQRHGGVSLGSGRAR